MQRGSGAVWGQGQRRMLLLCSGEAPQGWHRNGNVRPRGAARLAVLLAWLWAHPLSQPPLRPASSLLSERQRSVHPEARPSWPHRQGAVYSDPPFLPLQPLTRPMEQLQRGTPWSPAPSPPHLPGWVGSRGRTAAHAGREGAPGRRGLFERKLVKGARAESPNTPMPVLSSHQPTAGGRQGHSRRGGPGRAFSRTGLGQAAA